MGGSQVAGAVRKDLGRDGEGRETLLAAVPVQTHGPEGRGSSREWGLLEGVCNSRLYFSSHNFDS